MFSMNCISVNREGHLQIESCDAVGLAREYGTPLYVMSENEVRSICREYANAAEKYLDGKGIILFASKALCVKEIYRIVQSEGLGADVVSAGELYTALQAGMDPAKLYFHGNFKTKSELEMALKTGVGRIVVDNSEELLILNELSAAAGKKAEILLRVRPGIDAHTHEFIRTGKLDSKFGVPIHGGEAFELAKTASELDYIQFKGIHCHIGSQIFEKEPFTLAAQVMLEFLREINVTLGLKLNELNLGGGFGVRCAESDNPRSFDEMVKNIAETVKAWCAENGMEMPFIMLEPGRSVVAGAGLTLYTVGSVKEIPDVRNYIIVDGGMTDNPRYALYGAHYEALLANKAAEKPVKAYTIAGHCCESGDVVVKDAVLPQAQAGDVAAVLATGAYNYSMASHYNRTPKPAMVFVTGETARLAVKRESCEDLARLEI